MGVGNGIIEHMRYENRGEKCWRSSSLSGNEVGDGEEEELGGGATKTKSVI